MTRALVWITLATALAGCGAPRNITETGNPELDASLTLRAMSSAPDVVDVAAPAGTMSVEALWLAVERVQFVRGLDCDDPFATLVEVPGFVTNAADLAPRILGTRLPADDYCSVRLQLDEATELGDAPAELAGQSLLVQGYRADDVAFQIRSEEDVEVEIRAATPITLTEASAALVVALDLAVWLDGVDLGSLEPDDQGLVRVDEEVNEDVLEQFEDNLEDALEFDDDDDDDDDDD